MVCFDLVRRTAGRVLSCLPLLIALLPAQAQVPSQWGREPANNEIASAQRASIVFATSNPRSPVSLFGHTFLVLHAGDRPGPDSVVVEFLGVTEAGADYLRAIAHHIRGRYALSYFSYKQREYFLEGRNLWIYPLQLSAAQLDRLKTALQDRLGQERHYTFMRWNCSFYILALVEEAAGQTRERPDAFVVPDDTLRSLQRQGLLGAGRVELAPSRSAQTLYAQLAPVQQRQLRDILAGAPVADDIDASLARALSRAVDHELLLASDAGQRNMLFRLKRRFPEGEDRGERHNPATASGHTTLSVTLDTAQARAWLSARKGFLGSENEHAGDLRHVVLEFLRLDLLAERGEFSVTRLDLLRTESNAPATRFTPPFTQLLEVGYRDDRSLAGSAARQSGVRFGRGSTYALGPWRPGFTLYATARTFDNGDDHGQELRLGYRLNLYRTLGERGQLKLTRDQDFAAGSRVKQRLAAEAGSALTDRVHLSLRHERVNGAGQLALTGLRLAYTF